MVVVVIFLGGGFGSICRYLLGGLFQSRPHTGLIGTLVVNALGCVAIGVLAKYFLHDQTQLLTSAALTVGFMGACFTTFSTFSLEALALVAGGRPLAALSYVAGSLCLCLMGTAASYAIAPSLNR